MNETGFSSKEELYIKVRPALHAKLADIIREGYTYIDEIDIWNYLIENKWSTSHDLMLCDIINDILKVDTKTIDAYLKEKLSRAKRTQYFDKNLEIL